MKNKAGSLSVAVATALTLLSSAAAHATDTNWGTHDTVETGVGLVGAGSFLDTYSFTLPTVDQLGSSAVANNLFLKNSVLNISSGQVDLFQGVFGDATPDTLKLSYSFDGTSGDTTHALSGLAPGSYYYEVKGTATGSQGGLYTLTSTFTSPSPVPEPETYGMLMAGLGLMGFIARRKSKQS